MSRKSRLARRSRAEQARINGAGSHGPVTPQGKAISCLNALKTGLTARSAVLLQSEDPELFAELRTQYHSHFDPQTPFERGLVDSLAAIFWRHRRAMTWETTSIDIEVVKREEEVNAQFNVIDTISRSTLAYQTLYNNNPAFANLPRYLTAASREYARTLRLLRQEQERRAGRSPEKSENYESNPSPAPLPPPEPSAP
jgi:hypothetical protein